MKRTTIRLNEHLLSEAKQLAAAQGRSLTSLIEDSLQETMARSRSSRPEKCPILPTYEGWGLRPGLSLDNGAALRDQLDQDDAVT